MEVTHMTRAWTDIVIDSFQEVLRWLVAISPRVLAAATLVLLGWAAAAIVRRLSVRLLRAFELDDRCARWGAVTLLGRAGIRRSPVELVGRALFWVLFVLGLLMGIEALDVPATAGLTTAVVQVLPNLLVAVLALVIGWLVAHVLAQAVLIFIVNAQVAGGPLVAGAVRWLVVAFAAGVALTQLGIAREMVLLVFGIALGGCVLALALAFGLGARDLAREALEAWFRRPDREERDRVSHV
jgi:hypothetical protein